MNLSESICTAVLDSKKEVSTAATMQLTSVLFAPIFGRYYILNLCILNLCIRTISLYDLSSLYELECYYQYSYSVLVKSINESSMSKLVVFSYGKYYSVLCIWDNSGVVENRAVEIITRGR